MFRVMAVYGIVGFVVLQIVDLAVPALLLPSWTYRLVALILLLGFPVAVVLAWAFEMTPEGVQRTSEAAPGELTAIVAAPASQRWPAGVLALVGVAALVGGTWWIARRTAPEQTASDGAATSADVRLAVAEPADNVRPSLAVLPFVNMSSDTEQEYFSDGMTEEILNTLVKIRELRVAGRTSAFAYKGENKDLREIGAELGVRYLIEGSVRKAGGQLRITAQLIDATDGSHLWSEQYDRPMDDVFAIQTEIAEAIAGELRVPLGLEGDEMLVTPTGDLTAYDLYLAGRTSMRERGPVLLEAMRMFEAAIARDSSWAPAWAALAEVKEIRVWYPGTYDWDDDVPDSVGIANSLAESERAALRAIELDPRSASALVALGSVHRDRGQWQSAEDAYRRALSLDPDNAEAHQQYGEFLYNRGRIAEAVKSADRAVLLDPAPIRFSIIGVALELDGRVGEATEVMRLAMERDSEAPFVPNWLDGARLLARQGETREAIEAIQKALRSAPWLPASVDTSSWWTEKVFEEWARGLEEARLPDLPEGFPWGPRPEQWVRMGQPDSALVRIVDGSGWSRIGLPWNPSIWRPGLDSLRSDPKVQAYMASLGLGDAVLQRTPLAGRTRPMILQGATTQRTPESSAP
ncbi:MAG: tetratricopeptide repeat protein [Gemmatimonadota bacterium]